MSLWNKICERTRNRWLCSAICTSFVVCVIFALPFWDFQYEGQVVESTLENAVSVVTVTKKKKKLVPIQKIEKKTARSDENTVPKEKKIEEIERNQEEVTEPEENPEESEYDEEAENQEKATGSLSNESSSQNQVLSDSEKKIIQTYKAYALSRIASKKTYPYSARSQGLEGKVRVRLVINPDGMVSDIELLEKSEHEVLNDATLTAIKKSSPFKKMAKGQKELTLTFVMDFSLN